MPASQAHLVPLRRPCETTPQNRNLPIHLSLLYTPITMKKVVDTQLVNDVLTAFGFPEERVQLAVHDLFADSPSHVSAPPIDRILTFKQVCELLSLSKSGLRRIIDTGDLKPIWLSERRMGFPQSNITAFIESRRSHNSKEAIP